MTVSQISYRFISTRFQQLSQIYLAQTATPTQNHRQGKKCFCCVSEEYGNTVPTELYDLQSRRTYDTCQRHAYRTNFSQNNLCKCFDNVQRVVSTILESCLGLLELDSISQGWPLKLSPLLITRYYATHAIRSTTFPTVLIMIHNSYGVEYHPLQVPRNNFSEHNDFSIKTLWKKSLPCHNVFGGFIQFQCSYHSWLVILPW